MGLRLAFKAFYRAFKDPEGAENTISLPLFIIKHLKVAP